MTGAQNSPWNVVVLTTHPDILPSLIVTGMHMSEAFGYTFNEVQKSGWKIAASFECLADGDTAKDIGLSMGRASEGMAYD